MLNRHFPHPCGSYATRLNEGGKTKAFFNLLGTSLEFILYSRSSCSLCEAMEDELRPFIEKYKITVKRKFIDNEPALEQLYGQKVPVLAFNEKTLCEYFLDPDILLKAIAQCY